MGPLFRVHRLDQNIFVDFLEILKTEHIDRYFDDGNVFILMDNHPVHKSGTTLNWIDENIGDLETHVRKHPR